MVKECVYRILLSYFTACVSLCIPCSLVCSPLVYSALVHSGSYFLCFSVPTAKRITFLPHLFQSLFLPFSHSNTQNTQRHTHTRAHTYTHTQHYRCTFGSLMPLNVTACVHFHIDLFSHQHCPAAFGSVCFCVLCFDCGKHFGKKVFD